MDGGDAVSEFVAATGGSVNFGGSVGAVPSYGVSFATWNDPANANGWAAYASILMPALLPLGNVVEPASTAARSRMTVAGGAMPGHGGCERHDRLGDARLSGRSDRRHRDGEPHRHHHRRPGWPT